MYSTLLPLGFIISFISCIFLIYLDKRAAESGEINIRKSPQTLHTKSISRFGGVSLVIALSLTSLLYGYNWNNSVLFQAGVLSLPAFIVGFLDDLKFYMKPLFRLILILPVPIIYFYYFDLRIVNLDIGFLDSFLELEIMALIFLCFSIVGMINAFNLIDGINGLLGSYLLSIILALNIVEAAVGEPILSIPDNFRLFTNMLLGALLAFLILNYPFGKIFMGDAGAYYLGAITCFGLIYIHLENNNSPWAVMCILAYPFTDLVFSVFRKKIIMKKDAMEPDAQHLHHLIFKRLKKLHFKNERARHFFTVIFITAFNIPYLCLSFFFNNNTPVLIAIFFAYLVSYLLIYFALSPRFLMSNGK